VRPEDDLGAVEREAAGALGKGVVVADLDADARAREFEDRPVVAGHGAVGLLVLDGVDLAVAAEQPALGVQTRATLRTMPSSSARMGMMIAIRCLRAMGAKRFTVSAQAERTRAGVLARVSLQPRTLKVSPMQAMSAPRRPASSSHAAARAKLARWRAALVLPGATEGNWTAAMVTGRFMGINF
jgi:hypothetical protein